MPLLKLRKIALICCVTLFVLIQGTVSVPALKTLGVGTEGPDFSLPGFETAAKDFSDLKGKKITLLLFWASWSRQSVKALKQAEKLFQQYGDKGLSVVGINVERQSIDSALQSSLKDFAAKQQVSFPNLFDQGLATFRNYGVIAVPTVVILDAERKIRFEMSGFPLVGVRDMVHFVQTSIEGKKAESKLAEKTGYQPDKKAVRAWNMGMKALQSKRTSGSAVIWFEKAVQADPQFILPHLSLGTFYLQSGKVDAAREQFTRALDLQKDNARALIGLARLELAKGEDSSATKYLERAIKADESFTPAYYLQGYAVGRHGDFEKAASYFSKAAEINPLDHDINVYQGKMFEENARFEQAALHYKKALQQLLGLQ